MRPEVIKELDQNEKRIAELIKLLDEELRGVVRVLLSEGEDAVEYILMSSLPRIALYFLLTEKDKGKVDAFLAELLKGGVGR
ncbi:MAG: hypothetical protein QXY39_06815 [Thermofilaceae archaeon]